MTTTDSHAKNRGSKLTATEKKHEQMAANRKAQMQWYLVGGLIVLAVVAAIVLISIYTEGSIGGHGY